MLLSERIHDLIILMIFALLPLMAHGAPSPLPSQPVELHLEGEVTVGGEQVVLGDVATIYAKDLENFKVLAGLVISRIPDDKEEVRLPASYLEARVRAALPKGLRIALHAPEEVVFRLRRIGISNQELSAEIARLARSLAKVPEGTELEVVPLSGTEQLKGLTLAQVRIEPQAEMNRWRGDLAFKVTRLEAGNSMPIWLRVRLRWFQKAWLAQHQLNYSESITPAHFVEGRVETTNLREDPIQVNADELASILKGSKLKRAILAQAPLLPSVLERRPDALAGAALKVTFLSESGVRVSADGNLVGPGLIGEAAKARLRTSRKIVTGKLVSEGLMEVSL